MATTSYVKSGVTANTPKSVVFGAGVYASGLPWDTVPTAEEVQEGLIGATNGGGKITITPELIDLELDGALVRVKGLTQKAGETAEMETNMAEVSAAYLAMAVGGTASESTDKKFDVIDSKAKIADSDYYTGFGYIGQMLDGRAIMVIFKNALVTEGMEMEAKNKEQVTIPTKVACFADPGADLEKLPYRIYIEKADGTVSQTSIDEIAS